MTDNVVNEDEDDDGFVEYPADVLREQLDIRKGPADGTVILFEYAFDMEPRPKKRKYFTYSALYLTATNFWYLSGQGVPRGVAKETDHDTLMKLLAGPNVRKASVATGFDTFKP